MADLTSRSPVYNPWKLGGLTWKELTRRVWKETCEDELLGRAAQLAFYLLLALFPALLFLTALFGLFPVVPIIFEILDYLRGVLPGDAVALLDSYLQHVIEGSGTGVLSLSLFGALWASSSGVVAIMEALNVIYDVEESRSFLKAQLVAIMLTIGLAGFIIISTGLVLAGEYIAHWVANQVGLGQIFTAAWVVLQWPVALALMLFAVAVIYYLAPNVEQDWRWVTPGSLFAVMMWLVVSLGFKLYVENFGNYNAAYGSLAGIIVLMLWFYWSGMILLIGGAINAEIAHAAKELATRRAQSMLRAKTARG